MNDGQRGVALACLNGAEQDSIAFPEIVGRLMAAGFERYTVDLARATATYYLPDGDSLVLETHAMDPIAPAFDSQAVQAAIREAQAQAAGYTYLGFCAKIAAAGCAAYLVSFPGRRAVYTGRSGEAHVEHFPQ
jgi:uncharacterized protein YbcV (DUF1398 family)